MLLSSLVRAQRHPRMTLTGGEDLKIDALLQELEDAEAADQVKVFLASAWRIDRMQKASSEGRWRWRW